MINANSDIQLHLSALDPNPDATFVIETYTDINKGFTEEQFSKRSQNTKHYVRTRNQVIGLIEQLEALNNAGAGVFIAVNEFHNRRRKKEIKRIRAVHADFDNATTEQIEQLRLIAEPTILIQSSPNKYHAYWIINEGELSIEEAEAINRHFVENYGADPAATDVTRLLRLAGFKHNKNRNRGDTPTVEIKKLGRPYSSQELLDLFPASNKAAKSDNNFEVTQPDSSSDAQIDMIVARDIADEAIKKKPEAFIRPLTKDDYPSDSEADFDACRQIVKLCFERGITDKQLAKWVNAVFCMTDGGRRDKWIQRKDYRDRTINNAIKAETAFLAKDNLVFNDLLNAQVFEDTYKGNLLFIHEDRKWLAWLDNSWTACNKGEEVECAKKVAIKLAREAIESFASNPDLLKHARKAHDQTRLKAMLNLASTIPSLASSVTELNTDPYLLGVTNGVVNLKTGTLSPNRPELKITMYCNSPFNKVAKHDRWDKFLSDLFPDDPDTIRSLKTLLGYSLTGLNTEEILVVLVGWGANGKSVFSNVITNILGNYAKTAPGNILKIRRSDDTGPRDDIACLAGSRYVSINETQAGDKLDSQALKIIAGREPISARHLYGRYFSFIPTFTPWLRTNHLPIVTETDDGLWRRLVIVQFKQHFKKEEQNPFLENQLLEEKEGILKWMIEGAEDYLKNGIFLSQSIKNMLNIYRKESDLFGEFLDSITTQMPGHEVEADELWLKWREWAQFNNIHVGSKRSMSNRMAERGFGRRRSNNKTFYIGLMLISESQGGGKASYDAIYPNFPF